jgi:predicted metalloprotease with PDZ domain
MDAPVKIGKIHIRQWQVSNPDQKQYTFRLALDADASEAQIDSFTTKLQKLVKEEQAVYGEVPTYDFGSYTFLASFGSFFHGDGMEHRNSTMITSSAPFTGADNQLSVFAHEFFHNWNVERIRPKSIEPFNFEKSNMSELLWVAEGFTQYYGLLLMKRAGFTSDEDFMQQMSSLINAKEHTPGGEYYTPIENSQRAVFADAGVSIDRTNYQNMFTTYYYYGGALALALDLQLRNRFGKSLDVFMQEMWKRFGKTEKAYTLPDMQAALASVSSTAFADNFFKKYVYDHQSIDYAQLLQAAGCTLQKMAAGKPWIGNTRITLNSDNQLLVSSPTVRNTPAYDAGIDIDDVLLQLDGKDLKQLKDIEEILITHKPGDVVKIVYLHRNERVEKDMTIKESPYVKIVPSTNGNKLSSSQMNFLSSWTSSHVKA